MSRVNFLSAALLCAALSLTAIFGTSCSEPGYSYRVALIGFAGGDISEERNEMAEYGRRRVEAELGVEVDFFLPGESKSAGELFENNEEDAYNLVVSMGRDSSEGMLSAHPGDTAVRAVALDFEPSLPDSGRETVTTIRYRVEEGAYICGYLAGHLTGSNDHPMTNPQYATAFIGSLDNPLEPYYDNGFYSGVQAAAPDSVVHRFYVDYGDSIDHARVCAEEACKAGSDIIFCTPGLFNEAVLEVAEARDALLILVGNDRYRESPDHILVSLVLRDDNAVFEAVLKSLEGDLPSGRAEWGLEEGVWSLGPFHSHDRHIDASLKQELREETEDVGVMDFTS